MLRNAHIASRFMRAALVEVGIIKVVLITGAVLLTLAMAVTWGFRHSIDVVNELDRQAEQVLVANYLERQGKSSIGQQKVQLTWDDAFKAAAYGVDPEWTDTYLGDFLHANFRYDLIYLVDPQGRPLRAWKNGQPVHEASYGVFAQAVRDELAALAGNATVYGEVAELRQLADTRWPFDSAGKALTRWGKRQVALNGRSGLLTIASLVPDTRMAMLERTPNHLVVVRFYDVAYLEELRADLLLAPVTNQLAPPGNPGINGLQLAGPEGQSLGWLNWKFAARGDLVEQRMQPWFLAFVCILLALLVGCGSILRVLAKALERVRESEAEALRRARRDVLTGLANRAYFLEQFEATLARVGESEDQRVLLAFFDLDNFKFVNDTIGHPAGDALVRKVAQRCSKRLRPGDVLARLGGDEFVLMRCCPRRDSEITALGSELMALFATPFKVDGRIIDVTASCGIAWTPDHGTSSEELLRKADIALYRAKQRGRARWRGFTPEMAASVSRRMALEVDLRKALKANALSLAFQPIVRASDGGIEGAEALLRWNHPEFGAISPGLFVPVAEQAGLMPILGWWILDRVFGQLRAWPQVNVSINLSPLQLTEHGFLDDLAALVSKSKVDPSSVTFEVTEGILLERGSGVFEVLAGLRSMGFGIALDDFGTGYSSLSYLRTFHFDRIKIDSAFVQNIENDLDAQAILKAIVALGRTLNARTVAEGVESLLQRELVAAAGCELIQGFFHYLPMSAEDFTALIASGKTAVRLDKRVA